MHRAEHRVRVLRPHPAGQLVDADVPREPQVHAGGLEHHPGLGLAVREPEVLGGERDVRVGVHRQALAGVEQLDQQRRVGAERGDVLGTEPGDRVRVDGVARAAGRRGARSGRRARPEDRGRRSHPVLGLVAGRRPGAAESRRSDGLRRRTGRRAGWRAGTAASCRVPRSRCGRPCARSRRVRARARRRAAGRARGRTGARWWARRRARTRRGRASSTCTAAGRVAAVQVTTTSGYSPSPTSVARAPAHAEVLGDDGGETGRRLGGDQRVADRRQRLADHPLVRVDVAGAHPGAGGGRRG